MMRVPLPIIGFVVALGIAITPANAAPKTYEFSGRLGNAALFSGSTNPEWAFTAGNAFSGTLVYDADAVSSTYDYINSSDWKLTFHKSPVVSLRYRIETANGFFTYAPPVQGSYAAFGAAKVPGGGWTGVDLRFQNYPIAGRPLYNVPADGYVGNYYAHSSFLSLLDYASQPLTSTGVDVDLAALFAALPSSSTDFSVRSSDPSLWNERGEG